MSGGPRKRILFTGAARVHLVSALPVIRRLSGDPRVEFFFTGGFRSGPKGNHVYTTDGFFEPFGIDPASILPVERAEEEVFDATLCAHLSPALPRSAGRTVQVFHGVSFKNLVAREKYLNFDFLCLAGRYHAGVYHRTGLVRKERQCLVTGAPKVDPLVTGALDRRALLQRHGMDPSLRTILYAPTGSKHNSMELAGERMIRDLNAAGPWNLLVKLHDHPKNTEIDWAARLAPQETDRFRLVRDPDVVPCLHAADLLLTDASSVSMEYSLMDRPIVFLDVPELFRDVRERKGFLDLETHGRKVGTVVERPEGIVGAIRDAFANPQREAAFRRAAAADIFHHPGRATDRVAGVVLHAAGLEPELPSGVEVLKPEGGA